MVPPTAQADDTGVATPSVLPPGTRMWVLQLNLCNSGLAGCYEGGRSVPEAYSVITAKQPDIVTVNEVCSKDVQALLPAVAQTHPTHWSYGYFVPAYNRSTGQPYKCKNGDNYGIGVLGHLANKANLRTIGARYPTQDSGSNELRAYACAVAVDDYYACSTHLASSNSSVAMSQCRHLMSTVVPGLWAQYGGRASVVGGDFNLRYGWIPNIQDCVPSGWYRKGDGSVQHVMATTDLRFASSEKITMQFTDHPGWLVRTTVS